MDHTDKSIAGVQERRGDASSGGNSSVDVFEPKNEPGHDTYVQPRDLDQAYWYMQEAGSHKDGEAAPHELKTLRKKIDWRIVPIMFCCYTMQFIDKVSLNVRLG